MNVPTLCVLDSHCSDTPGCLVHYVFWLYGGTTSTKLLKETQYLYSDKTNRVFRLTFCKMLLIFFTSSHLTYQYLLTLMFGIQHSLFIDDTYIYRISLLLIGTWRSLPSSVNNKSMPLICC